MPSRKNRKWRTTLKRLADLAQDLTTNYTYTSETVIKQVSPQLNQRKRLIGTDLEKTLGIQLVFEILMILKKINCKNSNQHYEIEM